MRTATHDIPSTATARIPVDRALYCLEFNGGPLDGHQENSLALPAEQMEIPAGPRDCQTRIGARHMPRLAHYQLTEMSLVVAGTTPWVLCQFAYRGTVRSGQQPTVWRRWWNLIAGPRRGPSAS